MSLAEKLVSLRKRAGLTQLDLAEKLNVSRQAISRWEVGIAVPSTDNLKVLGELYGVPIDSLLNDEMEVVPKKTETTEDELQEIEDTHSSKIHKWVAACVLAVLLIIAIVVLQGVTQKQGDEPITPLREMDSRVEDDYTICTFDIE